MNNQNIVQPALYHGLIWEPRAYRKYRSKKEETEKKLFTYDKSLEHLIQRGCERHPYPAEVFSLLIDHFEGELPSDLEAIAQDMLKYCGEWFNMAAEREKDVLILSNDPKNLRWGTKYDRYFVDGETIQCTGQREFRIDRMGNLPRREWYVAYLKDVPEDLVTFLYSKPFDQLPEAMQVVGNRWTQLYLPPEDVIIPVGRGGFGWSDVYFGGSRASRGVRRASEANAQK